MSTGQIVEVIGAVVDVEFPSDQVPSIYGCERPHFRSAAATR